MRTPRLAAVAVLSLALVVPLDLSFVQSATAASAQVCPPSCGSAEDESPSDSNLGSSKDSAETRAFIALRPFVQTWKDAIAARDQDAAIEAGLQYEIHWQGPEIWAQHRSFPNYQNLEDDNQFGLDAALDPGPGLEPHWADADQYMLKLNDRLEKIIQLASNGPELNDAFTQLWHVRRARAYLNVSRDAVLAGDFTRAASFVGQFKTVWHSDGDVATADVSFRRPSVATAINSYLQGNAADIQNILLSGASPADKTAAFNAFNSRVGQGVNVVNAAARGADALGRRAGQILECGNPNGKDFKNLELVATIQGAIDAATVGSNAQAGLDTSKGSAFDKLLPALETNTKSRYNLASTALRTALRALDFPEELNPVVNTNAGYTPLTLAAQDALDNVRQMIWGQFWATTGLTNCDSGNTLALKSGIAQFQ